ncbi:MAG: hypothetical protein ACOZF2_03385 [Thermodesulfobacteriota bacterium]
MKEKPITILTSPRLERCIGCHSCSLACAGCPVGCIHISFSRENLQTDYRYFYRQVSYDHESTFATGSMLGVTDCFAVLDILDVVEQADEASRVFLTSMVACLFARGVYTEELLAECLQVVGYGVLADTIDAVSHNIQKLRWQARIKTGFNPAGVSIPKRFTEVITRKGKVDGEFLTGLKDAYARRILELARRGLEH